MHSNSQFVSQRSSGVAFRLAALLTARLCPIDSLFTPLRSGRRNSCLTLRTQDTSEAPPQTVETGRAVRTSLVSFGQRWLAPLRGADIFYGRLKTCFNCDDCGHRRCLVAPDD